jgi:hypothetical protein
MRVNSENMEDMIFLKSIYSYLGGVITGECVSEIQFCVREIEACDIIISKV